MEILINLSYGLGAIICITAVCIIFPQKRR